MELESVLVTGANRGIGLELVRQLVHSPAPPRFVFITYRGTDCPQDVIDLKNQAPKEVNVILIHLDVTNDEEIAATRRKVEEVVGEGGLQLLINNAGILKLIRRFPDTTEESLNVHFATNTVAPIKVFKEFYPLLQKAAARKGGEGLSVNRAAVINISSFAGSITEANLRPKRWLASVGYRTSKAALNMSMRLIAATVRDKGILVVNMCPGWVKTAMGGEEEGEIEKEESVGAILHTLPTLGDKHQGAFVDRHGKDIPF